MSDHLLPNSLWASDIILSSSSVQLVLLMLGSEVRVGNSEQNSNLFQQKIIVPK